MHVLNFENIENLVSHMFETLDNEDNRISIVARKEITVDVLKELFNYENVVLDICDVDNEFFYDREYIVSLFDDVDSDKWFVSIGKSYLPEKNKYLSPGGIVLFHEDVNSKALIDMQNNEFVPLSEHDWFTIGEENFDDTDKYGNNEEADLDNVYDEDDSTDSEYSITVKVGLDADEVENMIRNMEDNFRKRMSGMLDWVYRPYPYFFEYRPMIFG